MKHQRKVWSKRWQKPSSGNFNRFPFDSILFTCTELALFTKISFRYVVRANRFSKYPFRGWLSAVCTLHLPNLKREVQLFSPCSVRPCIRYKPSLPISKLKNRVPPRRPIFIFIFIQRQSASLNVCVTLCDCVLLPATWIYVMIMCVRFALEFLGT